MQSSCLFLKREIESTPVSICILAERCGVKGQTLRKQYKENISDYREWTQLEHAHDYILYPENLGENLSLDETCLSNGDVYTILTNKAAKGRKGALVSMVRGVATDRVSSILCRFPLKKRLSVRTVTIDLSSVMMLTVRKSFIINYFEERLTNASAESFNAKIKAFRSQLRGG